MKNRANLIRYWKDKAILSVPTIDEGQTISLRPGVNNLPWSEQQTRPSGTSYRVLLGILPHHDFVSSLLPIVFPNPRSRPIVSKSGERAYLAQFAVDDTGKPDPAMASLHPSLPAIKAFEIYGHNQRLSMYYARAQIDFRKKLASGRPVDYNKLMQLIHWLQGFLPRGCSISAELVVDQAPHEDFHSILELVNVSRGPYQAPASLDNYLSYLSGNNHHLIRLPHDSALLRNPRKNPASCLWPGAVALPLISWQKNIIKELRIAVSLRSDNFITLPKYTRKHRTAVALEVAAQYLAGSASLLSCPSSPTEWKRARASQSFHSASKIGMAIFSTDAMWLQHLEESFSLRQLPTRDPLLRHPVALRYPAAPGAFTDAVDRITDPGTGHNASPSPAEQLNARETAPPPRGFIPWILSTARRWWPKAGPGAPNMAGMEPLETPEAAINAVAGRHSFYDPPSVPESVRALRAFLCLLSPYYRKWAEDHMRLSRQANFGRTQHQRLAFLNRRLSLIYPIRLATFTESPTLLRELRGGKLDLAIVDCTIAPAPERLALICRRFERVILIGPDRQELQAAEPPTALMDALYKQHSTP